MNKKCKASVFLVEDCVEYFKNNKGGVNDGNKNSK